MLNVFFTKHELLLLFSVHCGLSVLLGGRMCQQRILKSSIQQQCLKPGMNPFVFKYYCLDACPILFYQKMLISHY